MTDPNSGGGDTARTTIEADRQVWRHVRAEVVSEGKNVSETLGAIRRGHAGEDEGMIRSEAGRPRRHDGEGQYER
jgi:hypothetical protein